MSEFKFACPVCGQHITADSKDAHSEISCPTCYRKIRVPQAPTSSDPKFVLSAAEANKPRPTPTAPRPESPEESMSPPPATTSIPVALIILLVLACVGGVTLFVVRGKIFPKTEPPPVVTEQKLERPRVDLKLWTLNLTTNTAFPEGSPVGRVHGTEFTCERAILQGGVLTLRIGQSGSVDLGVNIHFFARQPEELDGIKVNITTNDPIAPRVILRWKEGDQRMNQAFTGGYAMKLELGKVKSKMITGKIYLCLPDESKSFVAGSFRADVRRPPQPKTNQPKPAPTGS